MIGKKIPFFFTLASPITLLSSIWLKYAARSKGKIENAIFSKVGILPVLDHYYQPLINPKKHLKKSLRDDRNLPGFDMNVEEQLDLLAKFDYNVELLEFPIDNGKDPSEVNYFYNNKGYRSGDGEYLYNMLRYFKPKKIIEIGSGNSTLMAKNALDKNRSEDKDYQCEHICIEPYEMPWLESKDVKVIRKELEDIEPFVF